MATPNPAQSPSREGTRNVPRSDSSLDNDPKCLDTSLNFSYINFCNICRYPKAEVPLVFCFCQLRGPEEVLC
ncbi:hypothetical protein E2C01_051093 [Portunus trituberculatus]|uniref:Uncharacterized protein n=1 Tax=Portunus trituberculatus TaxID=210409 RepID=A0A5B7GHS3_PORTR|nr:hypothetical protein [Portunus trituberculatus]